MHKLRAEFFEEGKRLDADPETRHLANCWRCRGRIDYDAEPNSTDDSHNLGHFKSVRDFPELQEDVDNFRHEHRLCNVTAGADMHELGLGDQVPDWWV
jgi:hypothetical protein